MTHSRPDPVYRAFPLPWLRGIAAGAALSVMALTPRSADAQASAEKPPACLGFAFGAWSPALDWAAAGHGPPPRPEDFQRAPAGRSWAVTYEAGADTVLLLFPPWWPAGVAVALPRRLETSADTIAGRATALIADGRRKAPESRVRAWLVPCR
jgi:hypothetical protein